MLLSARITKLAFITQNNHVYEHTAEGPTPEILLNVRSPYRRQKRDLSIIRLLFRRSLYTGIEIFAIISTILPFSRPHRLPYYLFAIDYFLFLIFLPFCHITDFFLASCDRIDYFLSFYFLAIDYSLSFYLFIFFRSYRLFLIFLPFYDHIDYLLPTYISLTSRRQPILAQPIKTALDLPCPGMVNHPVNQIRA
jgi:hypothetical protein